MSIRLNTNYLIQGNVGTPSSTYIKVDENGYLVVGQSERPRRDQEDYNSYLFKTVEDPLQDPTDGNIGLQSVSNGMYTNLFQEGDTFKVTCLSDEVNGYDISPNDEYYNVIFSWIENDEGHKRYDLMGLQSTDANSPVVDFQDADSSIKNEPKQKWVFTEVDPSK